MADKEKLLVVEDDPRMLEVLRDVFIAGGYEVISATNGVEALHAYDEHSPDLVITDIKMPVMDGLEMVVELRKKRADVKVIYVTGWVTEANIAERLEKDIAEHPDYRILQKPFKIDEVWKLTDEYLSE